MNQLPRGFVHNGESLHVRMRNIKGGIRMRGGEGKELRTCAGARVSLLHTRDRLALLSSHLPSCPVSSFLHECTAIVVHRSFLFFFPRPPFALSCLSLRVLSFFSFFFFYFPTIIILSNFAHSKRWREFVEVTPRETRRIPNKAGLFICYEVNALHINATMAVSKVFI